jgi:transcriptional regulator with XRE-family HTH domain
MTMPSPYSLYDVELWKLVNQNRTVAFAELRSARGWTIAQIAEAMGQTETTVGRVEDGGTTAGTGNVMAYLRALDLEPGPALDGTGSIAARRGRVSLTVC